MKTCPNCGKKISEFALYCPFCGKSTTDNQQINCEPVDQKAIINQSTVKLHKGVGFATLFSVVTALLCFLVFLVICSTFMGDDARSAIISSGKIIFLRSLITLGVSFAVFVFLSNSKRLSTIPVYIIATIVCAAAHFVILASINIDVDGIYAWHYPLIKAIIPIFAIVLGIGISVLQGCLCIVARNSKAKFPAISFIIVIAVFLVFFSMGTFIGVNLLRMGVSGGFVGAIGVIAAIIATVMIRTRQ